MKRFLLCSALMAFAALSSVAAEPTQPLSTPVGRLLSTPHEMTISITAESADWTGTLLHQQGGSCGFSVAAGGGGRGGFGGGFGGGRPGGGGPGGWGQQPAQQGGIRVNGVQGAAQIDTSRLPKDKPVKLVIVASQKEHRFEVYANGERIVQGRANNVIGEPTWRAMTIGADGNGNSKFNGSINYVALWDRALSADEINKLYSNSDEAAGFADAKANYSWDIKAAKPITGGVPLYLVRGVNVSSDATAPAEPLTLWYKRVPGTWTDMLPIGNGHMGAMIAGRPEREYLILNEDTIWAGGPYDHLNPDATPEKLAQMRQLIFDGKADQAGNIANSSFISRPSAEMAFSVAGALGLEQDTGDGDVTGYIHSLNIREAVAQTKFTRNGVTYTREYFASYPDRVIAMRLTADKPASITVGAFIGTAQDLQAVKVSGNTMTLTGRTIDYNGIKGATNIQITGRVFNQGGKLVSGERGISVEKADSVVILLDAESSFKAYNDVSGDPAKRIDDVFKKFATVDYDALKKAHIADYRKLFDRVTFDLGGTPSQLPTDQRLAARNQRGNQLDPDLASLYFQFGRYLLIASSRPGSQPANLQGIWSEEVNVSWQSKYTININAEMNYWPAETANLSECHEPLFDMIHEMVPNGKKAAKKLYDVDHGWVAHHNTDLWRQCGPIDFSPTGMWPMGGAWLCLHFWDHYQFTRNLDDLRKHYPVMKESVEFYLDFLQPDPKHGGVLVTIPSYSPEQGGLCASPTMDTGILTALFKATIESSKLLNDDPEFRAKMEAAMKKFPPFTIGTWGQLREWQDDMPDDNPNNKHRHVSHLFTVFPGNVIRASDTDLFNAAKVSLNARGDDATGWSMGWKINLWARLLDGDRAWRLVGNLITPSRTYNNLFDAHPPFQIDGNFGGAAGMIEILLQSQETTADGKTIIDVLPCLPKALPKGNVSGLKARGNATVAIQWDNGTLGKAVISDLTGIPIVARYNGKTVDLTGKKGSVELTAADFK